MARLLLEDEALLEEQWERGGVVGGEPGASVRGAAGPRAVKEIVSQVELFTARRSSSAKTELRADLRKEARVAGGLGIAAVTGLITVVLLLVTAVLALSSYCRAGRPGCRQRPRPGRHGHDGLVSWSRRLRDPMARTHRRLKDITWARERLA